MVEASFCDEHYLWFSSQAVIGQFMVSMSPLSKEKRSLMKGNDSALPSLAAGLCCHLLEHSDLKHTSSICVL